eukprot:scaffold69853_cov23-Cyclotella_meneghiniana.AAC.1
MIDSRCADDDDNDAVQPHRLMRPCAEYFILGGCYGDDNWNCNTTRGINGEKNLFNAIARVAIVLYDFCHAIFSRCMELSTDSDCIRSEEQASLVINDNNETKNKHAHHGIDHLRLRHRC